MFHVDTFILKQKNRFGFTRCLGKPPATRKDNNFAAIFCIKLEKRIILAGPGVKSRKYQKLTQVKIVLVVSVSFNVCQNTGCFG